MTAWHDSVPVSEVFWFAKFSCSHPVIEIKNTIIIHIENKNRREEFLEIFAGAGDL